MDIYRNKIFPLKSDQKGQSTVEYILLFAVVTSLVFAILNSNGFNRIFGENGMIAETYRQQLEFSYRHGFVRNTPSSAPNYSGSSHESYNGKFFSAADPYP
tara:strand:- start:25696 stop:25998 length:303 start_codon:yes stop_codon:yes gene_type:complete